MGQHLAKVVLDMLRQDWLEIRKPID